MDEGEGTDVLLLDILFQLGFWRVFHGFKGFRSTSSFGDGGVIEKVCQSESSFT